jgi:hypothetical protein
VRLELALPGRWFALPLGEPGARERIAALARELHGAADDRAGDRIALRRRLEAALERAEAARAEQVHLGIALETGVPMPAVASVYPAVPVPVPASAAGARGGVDPDAVLAALEPLVLRAAHETAGGAARRGPGDRVLRTAESRVLRRATVRAGEEGSPPSLAIDCWITVPGARRAVLLHLDLPLVAPEPLLLALGDAIALAARFTRPAGLADRLRATA